MIYLTESTFNLIVTDALHTFPDECCGFFFGYEKGDDRFVTAVQPVNNAKEGDKRRRFEISALDYLKAERYADEHNLTLLGVYHSHPNHPSVPSEHDRVVAQPFFSYIIVAVRQNEFVSIQSWRLNDNTVFEEEQLQTAAAATPFIHQPNNIHSSIN